MTFQIFISTTSEVNGFDPPVSQQIGYTDFKMPQYELYRVDRVVMLKSEY